MQIYPAVSHQEMPWANGQGTTWQVALSPEGGSAFDWRMSFAAVEGASTFSSFPGVDRVLTLVEGERLLLHIDGEPRELPPFEPFAFPGEAAVSCVAPAPTTDFNVMTRRGRLSADVECVCLGAGATHPVPAQGEVFVVAMAGHLTLEGDGEPIALQPRDVVRGAAGLLSGDGRAVVVVLHEIARKSQPNPTM